MRNLAFFTDSFPLGGVTEPSFISPELSLLEKSFNYIFILPENSYGANNWIEKFQNFSLDTTLVESKNDYTSKKGLFQLSFLLLKPFFFKLLLSDWHNMKDYHDLFSFLRYINKAISYAECIEKLIHCGKINPDNTVFYSFWFMEITFALALLSNKYNISFCCRAHGYDIFDERVLYRSHSIRNFTLSRISKVFVCSKMGASYIKDAYPYYKNKIDVSYLGCDKLFNLQNPTQKEDESIVFFTCARFHPVKRIPMTLSLLKGLANHFHDYLIKWIVVGDGLDMPIIQQQLHDLPQNMKVNLFGEKENKEVHKIYIENHIDWNILLSESEGFGITVCEGLAYGVPAIVTNVGGLSEIIEDGMNGILLSPLPQLNEMIEKLSYYTHMPNKYCELRKNAYDKWCNNFNSRAQRKSFVEQITKI